MAVWCAGPAAQPVFVGTDIFPSEEFAARRARVVDRIGDAVAILQGASERPGEQPRRGALRRRVVRARQVGGLTVELLPDFFEGFSRAIKGNVHVKVMYGRSSHHKIEAIFKAFGRALAYACSTNERMRDQLPSTKGLL